MEKFKFYILIFLLIILCYPQVGLALTDQYPKLANYYLKWQINDSEAQQLAKWDVLILDMQNQFTSEDALKKIKKINPDITLLAYITIQEVQTQHQNTNLGNPWRMVYDQVNDNDLWLRNSSGQLVSVWSGTNMIDLSNVNYQTWLPNFLKDQILVNEYWDGIFLDNCFANINWVDNDLSISDDAWQLASKNLLSSIKSKLKADQLLVVNSSSNYQEYINGRLYEGWPKVYTDNWQNNINDYFSLVDRVNKPTSVIINSNTNNQGDLNDYQDMRFGLTSTLLSDGYFSFDYGDQNHAQTWWYDEYDQNLGQPIGEAYNLIDNSGYGVWRRDFEQGTVLINPSLEKHRINLGGEFEKITGQQDLIINDGLIVKAVNLEPQDGLIVLRRSKNFSQSVFRNGSFVNIFNEAGEKTKNGFFVYDNIAAGGNKVVRVDLNLDGILDKVVAGDNWIDIYNDNKFLKRFYPYTANYNQGINFTVGDLNGDGWVEIITGTERGGGPQIRIFSSDGRLINPGFFAYDDSFRGGVSVAVADMNNDGNVEIIAGAGYGGGPHVRIFNDRGDLLSPGFMAFDPSFRSGVTVATGDVNGDGIIEIVTIPTRGQQAEVRIFTEAGELLNSWLVDDSFNNLSLELAVIDLSGDDIDEIIIMNRDVFSW